MAVIIGDGFLDPSPDLQAARVPKSRLDGLKFNAKVKAEQ